MSHLHRRVSANAPAGSMLCLLHSLLPSCRKVFAPTHVLAAGRSNKGFLEQSFARVILPNLRPEEPKEPTCAPGVDRTCQQGNFLPVNVDLVNFKSRAFQVRSALEAIYHAIACHAAWHAAHASKGL